MTLQKAEKQTSEVDGLTQLSVTILDTANESYKQCQPGAANLQRYVRKANLHTRGMKENLT